jgi:hypothetical protein
MTGGVSTRTVSSASARVAAGFFLVLEAMWWAANTVLFDGFVAQSAAAELVFVIPVVLMFLSLLAVFLLIQAPRSGVWLGLAMQVIIGVQGLVLTLMTSLFGPVELALGLFTALCLAGAAPLKLKQ